MEEQLHLEIAKTKKSLAYAENEYMQGRVPREQYHSFYDRLNGRISGLELALNIIDINNKVV